MPSLVAGWIPLQQLLADIATRVRAVPADRPPRERLASIEAVLMAGALEIELAAIGGGESPDRGLEKLAASVRALHDMVADAMAGRTRALQGIRQRLERFEHWLEGHDAPGDRIPPAYLDDLIALTGAVVAALTPRR